MKSFTDTSNGIANKIEIALLEKGMLRKDLARKLKKKEPEISKWMSGNQNFTLKTIFKIEQALGIELIALS